MLYRLLSGLAALLLAASAGHAAVPARPRVVLAVDGIAEPRNLPVLLAERLGYFRDAGLIVTLVDAPAEPSVAQLTADGRADGAFAYYHHTFMTQTADGSITRAVAILGVTPAQRLMVASRLRDRVHNVADLKGLRIITGGPNSGKTTATNWAFLHAGLSIRDYTPLPLLPREAAAKALRDGSADAIMTHEPDAAYYETSGAAFELADLATPAGTRAALGTVYPSTALYLPSAYIAAHPAEVRALVGALLKALRFIEGHDAATIVAALPPKVGGADRAAFTRQVAADKAMFDGDGRIDPAAAAAELKAMAALEPKYSRVKLAETYTNAFVEASAKR
jgi:NitT/TauT family transport system substrate-binding protein